jgi:cytochrome c oxidase assembly factor CtaG
MHLLVALQVDSGLPDLRGGRLGSTQFPLLATLLILGAAALYLWGVWRVNRLQPRHPWSGWRTTGFLSALVVTALSIDSFIGVYDDTLFWDHMVQHLMLVMVAAPLFALGAPLSLLWRSTTGEARRRVNWFLRSPVARLFDHPVVAFGLYALIIPVTHLTSFYNLTLENSALNHLEHVFFLVVGYLFWRQVFPLEPSSHRMYPPLRLGYLFLAVPVDTFVGLSLSSAVHEMFPAYNSVHRAWGPSLVTDLHIGGVIMWVGGDTLMTLAMIPVAIQWMRLEERRAVRVDRELDADEPSRRSTRWSSQFLPR